MCKSCGDLAVVQPLSDCPQNIGLSLGDPGSNELFDTAGSVARRAGILRDAHRHGGGLGVGFGVSHG